MRARTRASTVRRPGILKRKTPDGGEGATVVLACNVHCVKTVLACTVHCVKTSLGHLPSAFRAGTYHRLAGLSNFACQTTGIRGS